MYGCSMCWQQPSEGSLLHIQIKSQATIALFHSRVFPSIRYQRPTLEELQNRDVRPYLLGGAQRPSCKNCNVAGSRVRQGPALSCDARGLS